jgi:uncharacterized protein
MGWVRRRVRYWSRRQRRRGRLWLAGHPRLARLLERAGCLNVDEYTLARGVAVGLFVGLTPTLGVQTFIMLAASLALRANFPAAFLASCVNNPFTVAPLYYGMNRLGQAVWDPLPAASGVAEDLGDDIVEEATALVLGSLIVAVPAGVIGYFLFLYLWRRLDLHLPQPAEANEDADGRL